MYSPASTPWYSFRLCEIRRLLSSACLSLLAGLPDHRSFRDENGKVIGKLPRRVTRCAATVEFRRDGTVATSFEGRETVSEFTFRSHSWPRTCTIEVRPCLLKTFSWHNVMILYWGATV